MKPTTAQIQTQIAAQIRHADRRDARRYGVTPEIIRAAREGLRNRLAQMQEYGRR